MISTDSGHARATGTNWAARDPQDVSRPDVQPADEQRGEQQQKGKGEENGAPDQGAAALMIESYSASVSVWSKNFA
jgi:hypothetical protein